jgi:hypothetical protein
LLEEADRLVKALPKKGIYIEEFVKSLWHVHVNGERRDIVAEAPSESDDIDKESWTNSFGVSTT